ncbi:immunoglobulin-like domain-containing protein [Candidatus Marinarcus aquaticus]|uniref:LapA adhesin domain-containing protein n=1 Tax=Candidatus Marinarcus aquaticus TaxID=2044504 RepID=A0A4Q0XQP0_9BACT|nr:immunoglobulin-like domain-containing protein [Candidatus Marinarcus aquaticus]RXJ54122.1 hypothetical protein CRV04_12120 [Candidatus Marinarcus aquaticus]
MSNVIKITDKNGNIQELQVDKNIELSVQSGDYVFIDELLNAVQLEIINNDNLKVVFPNGNEVVLNDIAKLISENPTGEIAPQFSDEELINSLTTKLEFLQNDLFDEGAVISNYAELLNALQAAAAGQEVLEDGSAAPEINIGDYKASDNEYELGHLRTAQADLNDDLVPGEAANNGTGTGDAGTDGTGTEATPLNTVVSLSATDTNEDVGEIVITATLTTAGETDVTITTEHGDILIPAGETTGTLVVDVQDSDVYLDPQTFSATVSEVSGGNFDNVDFSDATTTAQITDTIDTTTMTLETSAINEDSETVTVTAKLDNPAQTDMTVTLEDGTEITIEAGKTEGSTEVNLAEMSDVYNDDNGSYTATVESTTGGNFEKLDISGATVTTAITDTIDTTTMTLETSAINEDSETVTVTAKLDNPAQTDMTVTLEDGTEITIEAGKTEGSTEVNLAEMSDVYNDDNGSYTATVESTTGGNFEKLDISGATVTTAITDTIDTTTVTITGTVTSPSTIDVTNIDSEPNGINVYALDLNGDVQDLSVVKGTNHDGFGVNGKTSGSGASSELGHGNNGVSEKIVVDFDSEVKSLDVSFAWRNNRETAKVTFFDDEGNEVGSATVSGGGNNNEALVTYYDENGNVTKVETAQGGSDKVDLSYKFEPGNGQTFSKVEFSAPGYDDDYLINKITYKEVVNSDVTDVITNNGEVTLEIQTSNPPQAGTTAIAVVEVGGKEYHVQLDVNGRGTLNVEVNGDSDLTATVKEIIGGNFEDVDTSNANWDLASELISLDDNIDAVEDQTYYLDTTDFGDEQINVSQVKITELPENGTLYMNSGKIVETIVTNDGKEINVYENKQPIAAGTVITMADIAAGKVSFEPDSNSDEDGSFKFQADDGNGNFKNTEHTTTIKVTAVADAPTLDMDISDANVIAGEPQGGLFDDLTIEDGQNLDHSYYSNHHDQDLKIDNMNAHTINLSHGDDNVSIKYSVNGKYIELGGGDDNLVIGGSADNSTIYAGSGDDNVQIDGNMGSYVHLGSGDDNIQIASDANFNSGAKIDGGWGKDTLFFTGNASNYAIVDFWGNRLSFEDYNAGEYYTGHEYKIYKVDGNGTLQGNPLKVESIEKIVFEGDMADNAQDSYEYTIDLNAQLTDTDGSETLSDITLTNLPAGTVLKDSDGNELTANDDGSYTVPVDENGGEVSVTLSSQTQLDESALKEIKASVTSTEENGGDTETVSATDDSFIIEEDTVLDFDSLSQDQLPQASTLELGNGAQTLENVEYQDILSMASTDENSEKIFKILGDSEDTVNLKDGEGDNKWTKSEEQFTDEDGETFDVYTNQDLTVFIDSDADTNITGGI